MLCPFEALLRLFEAQCPFEAHIEAHKIAGFGRSLICLVSEKTPTLQQNSRSRVSWGWARERLSTRGGPDLDGLTVFCHVDNFLNQDLFEYPF
jgi:hypothetical protein